MSALRSHYHPAAPNTYSTSTIANIGYYLRLLGCIHFNCGCGEQEAFRRSCDAPLNWAVASFCPSSQRTSTTDHSHAMIITVTTSVTITVDGCILAVTD